MGWASVCVKRPGRLRTLLIALILARGVVWLCVLPPFEGWDEYQHLGYVAHLAGGGGRAVLGETDLPADLLAAAVAFPQPDSVVETQLGRVGAVGYRRFWDGHDPRAPGAARPRYQRKADDTPVYFYQAQHAPLYYRLVAPLYRALGGSARVDTATAGLRAVNVLLTAAALAVALGVFRRTFRSEAAAGLAGLVLATHPLFLLNGARVASDALGVLLAVSAVALGLGLAGQGGGRRAVLKAGAMGAAVGLASLAKASNLALLPFGSVCLCAGIVRHPMTAPRRAACALLAAAGFLAVTLGDFRFNLDHYGTTTAMQEAVINRTAGRTPADLLAAADGFDWPNAARRLWVRDLFFAGGWSGLRPFPGAIRAYQLAATAGLAGAFWLALRAFLRRPPAGGWPFRDAPAAPAFVVLVGSYSVGLAYHMVHSSLAWGAATTNPWYGCPALPWFVALAVAGAVGWGRFGRGVPLVMAGAGLAIEFVGIAGSMALVYSGGATGPEALERLAWSRPRVLGTATLFAAGLAVPVLFASALLSLRDLSRSGRDGAAGSCLRPESG